MLLSQNWPPAIRSLNKDSARCEQGLGHCDQFEFITWLKVLNIISSQQSELLISATCRYTKAYRKNWPNINPLKLTLKSYNVHLYFQEPCVEIQAAKSTKIVFVDMAAVKPQCPLSIFQRLLCLPARRQAGDSKPTTHTSVKKVPLLSVCVCVGVCV